MSARNSSNSNSGKLDHRLDNPMKADIDGEIDGEGLLLCLAVSVFAIVFMSIAILAALWHI